MARAGDRGDLEAACILLGLGTSRSYNSRVHPEPRAGRGSQGQLGPGPWGAASVVEASRGCCLDPLTCLGPQHSSQSPQGEGRRTWSPPRHWPRPMQTRPPTRQEDAVEPGSGDAARVGLHRGQQVLLTSAPTGPGPAVLSFPPLWPARPPGPRTHRAAS